MQESSSFQEWWNETEAEESSSAFASMPNRCKDKDKEAASSIDEENGENPSQDHPQGGGDNAFNDTDTIMHNNPYLPHRFQDFSPSHAQLCAFHTPQKQHEHLDDNLFPLPLPVAVPHPHSPVRHKFGNEFDISPERLAPAAHPPSTAAFPHPHSPVRHQIGHEFYISPEQAAHPLSTAAVQHPHSPIRRQFGNEFYISPERPGPAPAAHLDLKKDHPPSTATVATETEVTPQTYAVNKVSLFFCFMYITLMPCFKSDLTNPV
eukprot:scaffold6405_cov148-Skeletonema_dohrnii-CCMP3373.AAC.1